MFEKQPTDFLNFIHKWLVWNLIKMQNIQIPVILVSLVLKSEGNAWQSEPSPARCIRRYI